MYQPVHRFVAGIGVFAAACSCALATESAIPLPAALIPKPVSVMWENGLFRMGDATALYCFENAGNETRTLAELLRPATGLALPVQPMTSFPQRGGIWLTLDEKLHGEIGGEGYKLRVTPDAITIFAATPAGLFYGGQTLRQLLPAAIFAKDKQAKVAWSIPCCTITDKPRFAWRGFMLDYSRHWYTVEYTKHLLDAMASQKLNVFHMHLTDDEGWRIEIREYPKLTAIGAWRGTECVLPPVRDPKDTKRYGGFFTQDQIRAIVAYAAKLHVNIMPEIDLPGHSRAICTAYPETQPEQQVATSGEQGVHGRHGINAISPAKEANYKMVDDIIGELATLFPFDYVHIGGDEVNHNLWKDCPQIKELIEREKLGSLSGAQVYFTKRLEQILAAHGKKMIGWNEICNDKLARSTGIMSWTGTGPGYHAVRKGFPVVMAPAPYNYFDMGYPDGSEEPPSQGWAGLINCEKCYAFDPLAENGLDEAQDARILGVHACLWSESITPWQAKSGWVAFKTTGEHADYKAFPRLCALAEVGWTPQAQRNYADFATRLGPQLARLKNAGVIFRVPSMDAVVRKGVIVILPPYAGAEVRYTLDGTDPLTAKTTGKWDGEPVKGNAARFRARVFLDDLPGPLRSSARIEPVARWDKKSATPAFTAHEIDLTGTLDEPGLWRLTFRKTGGKHHLAVCGVELFVNGKTAAKDAHNGGSAGKGTYRFEVAELPAGAKVTARMEWMADCGADQPDTAGEVRLAKADGREPAATVTSTIGHYGPEHAPEMLADYDRGTFFWSDRPVRKGESVTITFADPVELSRLECISGDPNDPTRDILAHGELAVSTDGTAFRKVADFADGAAKAELPKETVKAVRITVTADSGKYWMILQDLILK